VSEKYGNISPAHRVSLLIQAFSFLPSQARKIEAENAYENYAVDLNEELREMRLKVKALEKQKSYLFRELYKAKLNFEKTKSN